MDFFKLNKSVWGESLNNESGQSALVFLAIVPICFLVAMILPKVEMTVALGVGLGIFFFVVAFVKTEIALYILLLSMLLSPEIGFGGGHGGADETKRAIVIRLEDFLLIVMGLSYLGRMAVDKDIGLFGKTPYNKYIGAYLAACFFSTIIGMMMGNVKPKSGFFYVLKYFEYYVVFFAVINYIHKEAQVRSFVTVMFITCFIVCIVGMAQIPGGGRVSAPFEGEEGEPNTMGGYLILMLALNGGLYLHLTLTWLRRVLFCNFFVILIPLMATGSRGSWLALPFVYIMWAIFSNKKVQLGVAGVILAVILPAMAPKAVKQRMMHTFGQKQHRLQIKVGGMRIDSSTSERLRSMEDAITNWQKRPLQGYGVTGFRFMDAQFFKVLIETGLIGILTFLALLWAIFRESYRVFKTVRSPFHRGLSHGFIAAFVGLCVHSIGTNTFIIVRIMEPFWFLAALVIMLPALEAQEETAKAAALEEQEALSGLPGMTAIPQGLPGQSPVPGAPNQAGPPDFSQKQQPGNRNIDLFR